MGSIPPKLDVIPPPLPPPPLPPPPAAAYGNCSMPDYSDHMHDADVIVYAQYAVTCNNSKLTVHRLKTKWKAKHRRYDIGCKEGYMVRLTTHVSKNYNVPGGNSPVTTAVYMYWTELFWFSWYLKGSEA